MTGVYLPSFLWHQTILYVFENNTIYNFELEDNELRIYYEDNMKSILLELQD